MEANITILTCHAAIAGQTIPGGYAFLNTLLRTATGSSFVYFQYQDYLLYGTVRFSRLLCNASSMIRMASRACSGVTISSASSQMTC